VLKITAACVLIVLFCGCGIGTRTERTKNKFVSQVSEMVAKGLSSVEVQGDDLKISGNGTGFYFGNSVVFLKPNLEVLFPEHHSYIKLKLLSINGQTARIQYEQLFDHCSFGKNLITIDSGEFFLKSK
jgi:hypothetical protein